MTAERNLFDRVVTLRLPGEDQKPGTQHAARPKLPLPGAVLPDPTACTRPPGPGMPASASAVCGEDGGKALEPLQQEHFRGSPPTPFPCRPGSVDHYPILVAVTGILVRLLVHGPASG